MDKKRVLFVTQEMGPYTDISSISNLVNQLALYVYNNAYEVRVLMPKFGTVNERRHRLHEVVRLSGMNIIVNEDDYPLIIKVASLPGSRMQVYFLDNEEFFKRKMLFDDAEGKSFEDNEERSIFFCKGVMETVKKFGWAPHIIHCHGWMSSLVPVYFEKIYKSSPVFQNATMIYSVYDDKYGSTFGDDFLKKACINDLEIQDLAKYKIGNELRLLEGAINHSDAIIYGSTQIDDSVMETILSTKIPALQYENEGEINLSETLQFYSSFFKE